MSTKQIATSTLWQIASQATMAALSILTVKFVALGLTKELAGNYNSAYGFLQMFGILADFGLYAVAVREVSKAKDKQKVLGALIVLRFIIMLASLLSALAIAWIIPAWRQTPLPLGITIAALVPFFTLLAGIVRTVFQVHYKMHYVFIAEVIQRIITTSLIAVFIFVGIRGSNDLHIYHLFLFFGGIGAFVLFYISLRCGNSLMQIRPCFDKDLMLRMLRAAAPFGIAFFCMALYRNLDVTLIALLRPDFELQNAYYGFVLRMAEMGYLIPTFLLNSTLPILSERESKGKDTQNLLGKTLLIILLLGTVSALFSLMWSRPLVQLLTTDLYLSTPTRSGSDTALRLLAVPMFFNGLVTYSFYVLLTKNLWKQLVRTLVLVAAVSLVMNWVLIPIPHLGFIGAGITSIVVHILLVALLLPQAFRAMHVRFPMQYAKQWLLFTALFAGALWLHLPLITSEVGTAISLISMGVCIGVIALLVGVQRSLGLRG